MKTYMKPSVEIVNVNMESLLTNVSGIDGVNNSNSKFGGGAVDGRYSDDDWDE